MDPIYSSITSHHSISQIDKTFGICDFSLIVIPLVIVSCWGAYLLYNKVSGGKKRYPLGLWVYAAPIGLFFVIAGLVYFNQTYGC